MPSVIDHLVGSKPVVPDLPRLNLGTEQQAAIDANQAALSGAEALTGKANLFSQQQITQMLNNVLPGYSQMVSGASGLIQSELSGQLPSDVQNLVQQRSAANALAGGTAGSEFGRNITARDLGLTSLQLTQQGLNSAQAWMQNMASLYEPSQMNVRSMFISPMQQYQTDNEQNMQQFQAQWMRNQISAMPDPWMEDLRQFVYRGMSAYSGTPVGNNPYQTPNSFGGFGGGPAGEGGSAFGVGGGSYNTNFNDAAVEPAGYGPAFSQGAGAMEGDFGAGFGGAGGFPVA